MSDYRYQVGGSLSVNAPTYVKRSSDTQLYRALKQGELCYVFNSRQMGKSSLLISTKNRLQQEGFKCTTVDMSIIGTSNITPLQWYKTIVSDLWLGFDLLDKVNLKSWWRELEDISLQSRLRWFIEELLLVKFPQEKLIVFVDEIDSILSLDFSVDDFFALIRFCYNQRAINPQYQRITFALFGVVTPSDLIQDKTKTPFNIGVSIALNGFKLSEVTPLTKGLEGIVEHPQTVIQEILNWTAGQPFLTQRICNLILDLSQTSHNYKIIIPNEAVWVKNLVKKYIIDNWESQDEPEHFRTIRNRIESSGKLVGRILGIYQQILQSHNPKSDDTREQIELLLSGLVVKEQGLIKVKNRIYEEVFNWNWVEEQLASLRPYSQLFDAWVASKQNDASRLLRGQALKDAQLWAQGKSLSNLDYQFFAASVAQERKEAQLAIDAERAKEAQARLRLQRLLLSAISIALVITSLLGLIAFWQYRQAVAYGHSARKSEVKALVSSSKGFFASDQKLNALIAAIEAKQKLPRIGEKDVKTEKEVEKVLQSAVYGADELNRLSGHTGSVLGVDISSEGELIATGSNDKTVKLWKRDGTLLKTFERNAVYRLKFSPSGQIIATAGVNGIVSLWSIDGTLRTLQGHQAIITAVAFSPDGKTIVSASGDKTVKLWTLNGTLLKTFEGHLAGIWGVAFSNDNQTIASVDAAGVIKLWDRNGNNLKSWMGHQSGIGDVDFSPEGKTLVSASADNTVKLWKLDGTNLKTFTGHSGEVNAVAFSADGTMIASASADKTVRIFRTDGTSIKILKGHDGVVREVAFSPDGGIVASSSEDATVKLWRLKSGLMQKLTDYTAPIWGVAFSPIHPSNPLGSAQLLATGSADRTLKLWSRDGVLVKTIKTQNGLRAVAISPNGNIIAAGEDDGTVTLWQLDGTLVKTLSGHTGLVTDVVFSSDGEMLISAGDDKTVKLWKLDGTLLKTFLGHTGRVWSVDYSRDGKFIASASADTTVKLWRADGSKLRTLKSHNTAVWGIAISPDSQKIASVSSNGTVKVWRPSGTLLLSLNGDGVGFTRVAFSPNSNIIAAGSADNTIKLWKIDGTLLTTLRGGHTSIPMKVAFSPDNKFLASAGDDQTVIVWNLEQIINLDLLKYGCNWARDYLQTNVEVDTGKKHLCDDVIYNSFKK